ncbi:MAG: hypothetical protein QOF89_4901 [Acidobacteriota bacterium]|jgi:hypothetical protein|nr:hypothetical protein [Acidobacteriota bacterium]
MPRDRAFWWVLGSLVLAGAVIGFLGNRPHSVSLTLAPGLPPPGRQEAKARSFRMEAFQPVVSIPAGESLPLKSPTALRVDGEGNLYVLDSGDRRIKKYSATGEPRVAFGAEDLQNPSDVAVAPGGAVWVLDPNPRKVLIFDPQGAVTRRVTFDRLVWRLVLDDGGGFVATLPAGTSTLFQRYSSAGLPGSSFGTLFPSELQNALTMDGWMVDAGSGAFIYVFIHEGLLASYSPDGRLRYLRATIEAPPLPQIRVDAAGGQTIDPDAQKSSISGSLSEKDLYVLALAAPGTRRVLDVYDAESGSYRYSLEPPDRDTRYVIVTPQRLYSASRSRVTVWRRESGAHPGTPPAPAAVSPQLHERR